MGTYNVRDVIIAHLISADAQICHRYRCGKHKVDLGTAGRKLCAYLDTWGTNNCISLQSVAEAKHKIYEFGRLISWSFSLASTNP